MLFVVASNWKHFLLSFSYKKHVKMIKDMHMHALIKPYNASILIKLTLSLSYISLHQHYIFF